MKTCSVTVLLVLVAGGAACSSASTDEPPAADTVIEFDGVYASDVDERELTPEGSYRYRPAGCADEDCEEYGTYAYDAQKSELAFLLPDRSYTLPLEVEETDEPPSAADSSITTKNLLTGGQTKLLTRRSRLLRGKLGPLLVKRQLGRCSATQIQSAQAACRASCPGGSRGINYCTPQSYSCACRGRSEPTNSGGACNNAQRTYRRCMANQISCGGVANCRGAFVDATWGGDCTRPQVHDICAGW